jgi:hypothetical protein
MGELPVSVREAIEEHTGPVTGSVLGGNGFSTDMRLILHTETGDVFVKGVGPDGGYVERDVLDLGAELAPCIQPPPGAAEVARHYPCVGTAQVPVGLRPVAVVTDETAALVGS